MHRQNFLSSPGQRLEPPINLLVSTLTLTVNEHAVHLGEAGLGNQLSLPVLESTAVVPVGNDDWISTLVIVCRGRPKDGYGYEDAVGVLKRVVAVVPRCAVLSRPESVCESFLGSNWTLRHAV